MSDPTAAPAAPDPNCGGKPKRTTMSRRIVVSWRKDHPVPPLSRKRGELTKHCTVRGVRSSQTKMRHAISVLQLFNAKGFLRLQMACAICCRTFNGHDPCQRSLQHCACRRHQGLDQFALGASSGIRSARGKQCPLTARSNQVDFRHPHHLFSYVR
jgi:hypothetical protein